MKPLTRYEPQFSRASLKLYVVVAPLSGGNGVTVTGGGAAGLELGAVGAPGMLWRLESHALPDTVSKQPTTTGINIKRGFTLRI